MKPGITIVDYDCGNIFSVRRAFEFCGANVELAATPEDILRAERLVLPGVGAFHIAMNSLREKNMIEAIIEFAAMGKPFLGICVGMQLLFNDSQEFGTHKGLGLIEGTVKNIPSTTKQGQRQKIPHIGWNQITPIASARTMNDTLYYNLPEIIYGYFIHSFSAHPKHQKHRLADCFYGKHQIAASVRSDNIWGCQFHPEKSGEAGLAMLVNFLRRGA